MVTNVFYPRQLGKQEEAVLVRRCLEGDGEARNILIEHNLRLVAHVAKKFSGTGYPNEDMISIGSIGLIKAVTTYDPSKGSKLGTYAVRCIANEILMFIRSDKKHQGEFSLQDTVGQDSEGNEITLMELLPADDEQWIEEIDRGIRADQLREKVSSVLKGRERLIIEMRYGLLNGREKTQKEVGNCLGISRSYVSRLEKGALKKLRAALPELTLP